MSSPWLSIILPAINEEKSIGICLDAVDRATGKEEREVILVDGGSDDRTIDVARKFDRIKIVPSAPGRGGQMNRGAREAAGSILLFLHADVVLPPKAGTLIREALADTAVAGGWFRIRTTVPPVRSWIYRALVSTANWRSRFGRYPYGDQAVFVRRGVFEKMGGFAEIPIMEDIEFSRRLRREGRLARIGACVEVSGRRWERSLFKNAVKLKLLPLLYRLGVSPETLTRFYGKVR